MDPNLSAYDNQEFKLFLKMAEYAPILGVDTESNGEDLRDGRGHTTGMSVAFSHDGINGYAYYFPFRHEFGNLDWSYRDQLKTLIESKPITAHNLKHDRLALRSIGINSDECPEAYCSMLLAHNVWENYLSYGLDYLARNVVGIPGKQRDDDFENYRKAFGYGGIPPSAMGDYGARDAELHLEVFNHFKPLYDEEDETDGERWLVELEFIKLLNKIEGHGARVDLDLAQREISLGELRMNEIIDDLGYNPGSNKDLEKLLIQDLKLPVFKRSEKTDKPSFDKQAMEFYEEILEHIDSPVAKNVLEYRGYQKAVSSYWKAYLRLISPDGRVRPNFKQHGTKTGRLSCADPNLQQIPRVTAKPWNKRVKAGFIPRDGYKLWEADYSQLEMRLQAAYSKDPTLLEIFNDDSRDLFDEMAAALGIFRYDAKQNNYATGYGAQPPKIASMLGIPVYKAYRIRENYFAAYPGLEKLSEMAAATVKGQGYIRYWTKRRRHFENPSKDGHKAVNSVMQGGAAEIVKRTQIRLDKEIDPECLQLLQVHDAVLFEIPIGKEKKHLPEIKRIMEDCDPGFGNVPFKVDIHEWGK
jgi:DNA polymerase-1